VEQFSLFSTLGASDSACVGDGKWVKKEDGQNMTKRFINLLTVVGTHSPRGLASFFSSGSAALMVTSVHVAFLMLAFGFDLGHGKSEPARRAAPQKAPTYVP
jgi:hypothetical protein